MTRASLNLIPSARRDPAGELRGDAAPIAKENDHAEV